MQGSEQEVEEDQKEVEEKWRNIMTWEQVSYKQEVD